MGPNVMTAYPGKGMRGWAGDGVVLKTGISGPSVIPYALQARNYRLKISWHLVENLI